MAANQFTVRVNVQDGGDIEKVKRALAGLGATVTSTRKATGDANKSSGDFYDTQKKGIIGTANSTKSFSKLAETIGGRSSGLVAAYATLAANAFALTAAFNALRGASQVEQIFRGLEAAGVRTGRSLTSTAMALKEVTGNAISTEQALRSTAQITSAGFGAAQVERLGQAARDTSFALGRNMTDSLDRLSRGVVKLEPELLDELGIMTKLTESNTLYAQKLGKTEGQLTNFEKRQGFLNAVLSEAELKFGGLSAAAGNSTAYDKLAAKFTDLANTILNGANNIAKPFAGILASSLTLVLGLAFSFAATLRNQLLPGLAKSAAAATAQATAYKELAKQKVAQIELSRETARAEAAAALASRKNFDFLGSSGPAAFQKLAASVRAGTATIQEQRAALVSLERSQTANRGILENNPRYNTDPSRGSVTEAGLAKQATVDRTQREIDAIKELQRATTDANQTDIEGSKKVQAARLEARVATRQALAQNAAAATIGAASQLKLGEAWKNLVLSVKAYSSAQALASAEGATAMIRLRTALFAASVGARALGTALLTALPYIGLIVSAIGLIQTGIESLKSENTKALEKAFSELGDVTSKTNDYVKELARANAALAPIALRTAQVLTIQSNAIAELTEKFNDVVDASDKAGDSGRSFLGFVSNLNGQYLKLTQGINPLEEAYNKLARSSQAAASAQGAIAEQGFGNAARDTALQATISSFEELEKVAPRAFAQTVRLYGGISELKKLNRDSYIQTVRQIINSVNDQTKSTAGNVTALQESFKALEQSLSDFSLGSVINTKYDQVVKNFNSVTDAINDFKEASITTGDVQWEKLLSGVGAGMTKFLDSSTQKSLDQYRTNDLTVQTLEAQKSITKELSAEDEGRLQSAKRFLANSNQLLESIASQNDSTRQLFINAQKQEREYKSQLDLVNAQVAANQTLYTASGAGLKARIAREEQIRGIQANQIKSELQIQEISIARSKERENELKQKQTLTRQNAIILGQEIDQTREVIKRQLVGKVAVSDLDSKQLNKNAYLSATQGKISEEERKRVADLIDSYNSLNNQQAVYSKDQLARSKELASIENAIRDSESSIANLKNQLNVLAQQNLTTEQKIAKIREADNDTQRGFLGTLREQRKTLSDITNTYNDLAAVSSGVSDSLRYQITSIQRSADIAREATKATANEQVSKLRDQIASAKADAGRSGLSREEQEAGKVLVSNLEKQLDIQQNQLNIDLQKLDVETKLSIAQKVYFDTAKEGLDWQQTSLDYLQKQLDTQRSLSDEAQKTYENRIKLRVAQRGVSLTDAGQQAIDINSAREAYKLAVQESDLKKSLIDLQFALLDAQKDQLIDEMSLRRQILEQEDNPANATRIQQLDATVARLQQVDLGAVAQSAKDAVDRSVENAKSALEISRTIGGRSGPFSDLLAGMEDLRRLREQRAANDNPRPIASGNIVKPDTLAQKNAMMAATNPIVESNNKLVSVINLWIEKIEKSLNVQSSAMKISDSATGRVKQALDFFTKNGYSAEQAAGIVGNLQQESGKNLDPNAVNKSSGARGLAQWLGARSRDFQNQFGKVLKDSTFEEQLQFILWELSNTEKAAGKALKATKTIEEATQTFRKKYERPGEAESNDSRRLAYARSAVSPIMATNAAAPVTGGMQMPDSSISVTAKNRQKQVTIDGAIGSDTGTFAENNGPDLTGAQATKPGPDFSKIKEGLSVLDVLTAKTREALESLGPQGEVVKNLYDGVTSITSGITNAFEEMNKTTGDKATDTANRFTAIAAVAQTALATVSSVLAASAAAKEDAIDREINAEQKRDGKSAESVAKIAALEKKKDQIAKKQFNTNKKLMMAQAVIATAAGVAQALAYGPIVGPILAGVIAAMGAAQLAIIAGTQYQSSAATASASAQPPSLTIGKVGDTVDVAKQNNNVGGELGYLRGKPGVGSNSSNYSTVGSAYGGEMPRGYGNTAYVVGEKGPETITPTVPVTVRPANDNRNSDRPIDATINIHALDARGVEDILHNQRGNLISMFREAANANGEPFMESINLSNYSRPNSASRL